MKTEDRIWVEFLIFCGFILFDYIVLAAYGLWFDPRPFPTLRVRLAENLKVASEIRFHLWCGPYLLHLVVRVGLFFWRRKRSPRGA